MDEELFMELIDVAKATERQLYTTELRAAVIEAYATVRAAQIQAKALAEIGRGE